MSAIKKVFISRFHRGLLAEFDLSQIEIVVQAFLSQDKNLINDLRLGVDLHCKRLAQQSGEAYHEVYRQYKEGNPFYVAQRKAIKTFSFQRAYGAGVNAICETTGLSYNKVKELIKMEEEMYPQVKEYYKYIEKVLETAAWKTKGGEIRAEWRSLSGKSYVFTRYNGRFAMPKIMNYPVQGMAAEIIKIVCILFYNYLRGNNLIKLINTKHDDVLFDMEAGQLDELRHTCRDVLNNLPRVMGDYLGVKWNVPISGTLSVGESWGKLITVELPS